MKPEQLRKDIAAQFPGAVFAEAVVEKEGGRTVRVVQRFTVGDKSYTTEWTPPRPDPDETDEEIKARRGKQREDGLI
jgi:hypothetical protein